VGTRFPEFVESAIPLAAKGEWSSAAQHANPSEGFVVGCVYSDQKGTLHIEQGLDGENWDVNTSYEIEAKDGNGFREAIVAPYWRVRLVNGEVEQKAFRICAGTKV
jgi:hypothetical protein